MLGVKAECMRFGPMVGLLLLAGAQVRVPAGRV
jgi:hypothetical protein